MRLKIVSNGTAGGTHVINAETGERVEGVLRIDWRVTASGFARAEITLYKVPVEVEVNEPSVLLREIGRSIWGETSDVRSSE